MTEPAFSLGIEEEYLLVDRDTLALAQVPTAMFDACRDILGDTVSPEFLDCQIEVGTPVCRDIGEARDHLKRMRATIAQEAARHNLAPLSAGCHPSADWADQNHTRKDRYDTLQQELKSVADRMIICGMHIHVGLDDDALRADLINQMAYFLPHLLALSTASPFWKGRDSGLASYRIAIFDNMPRTGLPPQIESWGGYRRSVDALVDLGIIDDASKIWWDLRPSNAFPTLETRICDAQPRLEHALSLAALNQGLLRMLWRLKRSNQRWRDYDGFLLSENRWRAQRYGVTGGLIDFGRGEIVPMPMLLEEMIALIAEDAAVLGCLAEVKAARDLLQNGTSAERQRAVFDGADRPEDGLKKVVQHLIAEFQQDL